MGHPGLAGEHFTYLGDQANMPYGNYDAEGKSAYLRELAVKDALFLVSDGYFMSGADETPKGRKEPAKIVVIACNTATAYGRDAADSVFKCVGARQKVIGVINAGVRSTLRMLEAEKAQVRYVPGKFGAWSKTKEQAEKESKAEVKAKKSIAWKGYQTKIAKKLEAAGVSILVCGTCLEYYGLLDSRQVGETTNMLDIVTSLDLADKVIRP